MDKGSQPDLDSGQKNKNRILFGKGPGGWDSWDSWDGWDGWDSWDQQINRQLEAQSW